MRQVLALACTLLPSIALADTSPANPALPLPAHQQAADQEHHRTMMHQQMQNGPSSQQPKMDHQMPHTVRMGDHNAMPRGPAQTMAQNAHQPHQMQHGQMGDHGAMQHGHSQMMPQGSKTDPREPGQSAFAAIQEIVAMLRNDPKTDWSKVDIEGLRQHLIDMNNVTLAADVKAEVLSDAVKFTVTGAGNVQASIQRMVVAHADTMDGVNGWKLKAEKIPNGATLTVSASSAELPKLRALGFIGIMTEGMHHQEHHLALARGTDPHHKH